MNFAALPAKPSVAKEVGELDKSSGLSLTGKLTEPRMSPCHGMWLRGSGSRRGPGAGQALRAVASPFVKTEARP